MADPVPYATWKPTGQQIAYWLRSRTGVRTNAGAVVDQAPGSGSFDGTTVESDTRVAGLIDQESPVVIATVGEPCHASLKDLAAQVVGYRVCAAISADGRNGRTEPDWWTDEADKLLKTLEGKALDLAAGDEPGPADNTGLMSSAFPCSPLSVVGYDGYIRPRRF